MRSMRAWLRRAASSIGGSRHDRELDAELQSHLEMHVDDNLRLGMSADEARRQALIRLGGVAQVAEAYRDRRGLPAIETVLADLRFTWRLLRRSPGFAVVILRTMAIGIGANAAIFSVVNTLLLRPLPYREPGRPAPVQTMESVLAARDDLAA